jgi:DNA-binding MarR family transcriptional regulator
MTKSDESAALVIELIDEMIRGHGRWVTLTRAFSDPGDLTGFPMTVLTAIVLADSPPTVPQIGRSLGHSRQTVQRVVGQLVEAEFITQIENPDHKRAKRLVPTDSGRQVYADASQKSLLWARDFAKGFEAERLADTIETLHSVRVRLEGEARSRT